MTTTWKPGRPCAARGCHKTAHGRGKFCNAHYARWRRHGHPTQRTITKTFLAARTAVLQRWLSKQPGADKALSVIDVHFEAMVDSARSYLKDAERGISHRPTRDACRDIVTVANNVDKREAAAMVMTLIILMMREDITFASHDGFLAQLGRRWRGQTEMHVASMWSQKEQRVKRVFRDPTRRSLLALGKMLIDGLGRCADSVMDAQKREAKKWEALNHTDIAGILLGEAKPPSETAHSLV